MLFLHKIRRDWFSSLRGDTLSGLVVALALIPEAIAFSLIAGVDPKVGLYASFCIAVVIAFTGGRPGMISAATGAMALLMVTLVRDHGLEYLLAATVLTGVLQIIAGYLRLADLMRFVSRSVVTGFVNALAILIFMAQLPELINVPMAVYPMVVIGLVIIYGLPRLTRWHARAVRDDRDRRVDLRVVEARGTGGAVALRDACHQRGDRVVLRHRLPHPGQGCGKNGDECGGVSCRRHGTAPEGCNPM